ncbi:hypothetical protein GF336_02835 [Candidatus Woesearchaeota archaeon]|nr:hypothetical protein [Candidatus Woesearchaeota archaeon]
MLNIERGDMDNLEGIASVYLKNSTDYGPGYAALDISYAADKDIEAHFNGLPEDLPPEAREQIEQAKDIFRSFEISRSYYDHKSDITIKKGDIVFSGDFPLIFSEHILMGDAIRYMCSYLSQDNPKDKDVGQTIDEKN